MSKIQFNKSRKCNGVRGVEITSRWFWRCETGTNFSFYRLRRVVFSSFRAFLGHRGAVCSLGYNLTITGESTLGQSDFYPVTVLRFMKRESSETALVCRFGFGVHNKCRRRLRLHLPVDHEPIWSEMSAFNKMAMQLGNGVQTRAAGNVTSRRAVIAFFTRERSDRRKKLMRSVPLWVSWSS